MNVTIYCRLSTDARGDGLGVERQESECRAYADARGWPVREVLVDNDISATTGKVRPAFERLLSSSPAAVLVWHTDRLARVARDLERVIELGVDVYAVEAGHLDLSTPAGRAVARTVTAWATYEGEQKAARARAAHRQRAAAGKSWWSSRPFGYELDGSLREGEARALQGACASLLAGVPLSRIAADLTASGHRTCRGNPWTPASLRTVLINPRNAAIKVYDGTEVGPAAWQPIVDEGTHRAVVRTLGAPARRTGGGGRRRHMLSGMAVCDACGSTVKGARRLGREYYVCRARQCVNHEVAWVDSVVMEHAIVRLEAVNAGEVWSVDSELEEARSEVVSLRERLAALSEDYAEGLVTREQLRAGSVRLRERLDAAEGVLARGEGGQALSVALSGAGSIRERLLNLDTDRRRAVVDVLMERIALRRRGRGSRVMRLEDVAIGWRTTEGPHPEG